jgi:hypothetical protein
MKAPAKLVLIALFSFLAPWTVFAASPDVMVVVNGNTETNREAYNYIRKTFSYNNLPYTVTATLNPATVKAGQYKSVVVLNTGTLSGLDPALKAFIDGYADKKGLFLVNLYKDKKDLKVTSFTASAESMGVDGVSAASLWKQGFGSNQAIQDMHQEWIKALVKFLGRA